MRVSLSLVCVHIVLADSVFLARGCVSLSQDTGSVCVFSSGLSMYLTWFTCFPGAVSSGWTVFDAHEDGA